MAKTRMITIQRTVEEQIPGKNGSVTTVKVKHWFPCKVNAAVPFSHEMCI